VSIVCVDNLVFFKCLKLLNIIMCLCILECGVACYLSRSIVALSDSMCSVPVILKASIHTP
jgi:hypothetical protein